VPFPGASASAATLRELPLPAPVDLGLDRIAHILNHADALTTWLKAIESYAKEQLRLGKKVPGYKLVEAQGRRRWIESDVERMAFRLCEASGRALSEEQFTRTELVGILEAEEMLAAEARRRAPKGQQAKAARDARERMAFLTLRESSGNLTMVPEHDSRPAADRSATVFRGVQILPLESGQ
jgi:hypothetical protein